MPDTPTGPSADEMSVARLRERIAAAARRCAVLRKRGTTEQYMAAFDLVETLEFQLEKRLGPLDVLQAPDDAPA